MLTELRDKIFKWFQSKQEGSIPDIGKDAPDGDENTLRDNTPDRDKIKWINIFKIKF